MPLLERIAKSFTRSEPKKKMHLIGVHKGNLPPSLFDTPYTKLSDSPEIIAGVNVIADLVSLMTIRLMENSEDGNRRVHNDLSRKLDITPNTFMTRKSFIFAIVQTLLLEGNQVTLPEYSRKGKLDNLHLIGGERVNYYELSDTFGYFIKIDDKVFEHEQVLHFSLNPTSESPYVGQGYQVSLKELLKTLKQSTKMKQVYMGGQYTPPLIISVATSSKDLSSPEGREKILEEYVENTESGKPLILPSDMMSVESVKPLTLKDVAINETIELDKKSVAAILGVPAFILGVGKWDDKEYNNFIETKIRSISEIIQQEMTRKLIDDEKQFIKFNIRSLKSFAQNELGRLGLSLHAQGILNGNEVREWIDLDPVDGQNERIILENYLPVDKLGDQKKLKDTKDE